MLDHRIFHLFADWYRFRGEDKRKIRQFSKNISIGLCKGEILQLLCNLTKDKIMKLSVKTVTGKVYSVEAEPTSTIRELKVKIDESGASIPP